MPSLQFSEPGAAQQLTVAEVLSQRVGLTRNAYDRDLERNVDYNTLVRKLADAPMKCEPGECYSYQNVAFSLVGKRSEERRAGTEWVSTCRSLGCPYH